MTLPTSYSPRATRDQAIKAATVMLSCYPGADRVNRPYLEALALALEGQPIEWVNAITDRTRGIPAQSKYMPTVADITAALDELAKRGDGSRQIAAEAEQIARAAATKHLFAQRTEADQEAVRQMVEDYKRDVTEKRDDVRRTAYQALLKRSQCAPGASIRGDME